MLHNNYTHPLSDLILSMQWQPPWDPFLKQDIELIEKVQKFALRVCTKSWDANYCNSSLLEISGSYKLDTIINFWVMK